ncbi:hypothetical protein K438DRAFT_1998235 [Mycena galopus ATCC 62051]|nr:hypothetical protein K438DRAFT_1998235 [Mycena galopus ATCC 62051]
MSNYTLELPEELVRRKIYPKFHSSLLRAHEPNDNTIFPSREVQRFYDFGMPDDQEWLVEEIVRHEWVGKHMRFWVKWTAGDFTWESPAALDELTALDDYFEAHGGLDPPPDPEAAPATTVGACTPHTPDMVGGQPVPQYTTVPSRDPLAYQGPQHCDYGEFSRVTGPSLHFRGGPPPTRSLELDPRARAHRAYTGPFANTMRQRDLGIARRQEEERRRNDEGCRRRDETTARRYKGSGYLGDPSDPHCDELPCTTLGGPDRAREHYLRERALHSRAPPGAKAKILPTRPVPDVDRVLHRPDGHPVPPVGATTDEDESDYGSSGGEDTAELQKFRTREHDRLAKVISKKCGTPTTDALPRAPRNAGLWGDLSIDDVPGTRNLVWWWSHGCPQACAYGKFIMTVYGNDQLRRRSDGVQYILHHANAANQSYLGAATGDSMPISRRDPNTVPRQVRRKWAKERLRREGEARTETLITSTTESSLDYDDTMPPAVAPNPVPAEPMVQSYSGSSPAPPPSPDAMTAHWLGPQMSLHDAMAHAATERPSEWRLKGGAIAALSGPNQSGCNTPGGLDGVGLGGFSVWGLFEHHIQLGAWIHTAHELEHYPFDATNITYSQSMQWVHAHGVDRRSVAAQELHAFATSWRNSREGLPTTTGEHFSGHDIENQESVLRWDIGHISSWATLWHGLVRSGVTSLTDRCPADGVRCEQQQARRGETAEDADMTDAEPVQGAPQTAPQPAPEDGELLGDEAPAAPSGGDATASSNGA